MRKRICSLLLVLALVLSLVPSFSAAAEKTVSVWFSCYSGESYSFPMLRQRITVKQDTVKKYGWKNAPEGTMVGGVDHGVKDGEITVADAILTAHEVLYGESFTTETMKNYIGGTESYMTKIFGLSAATGIMFTVNDRVPVGEMTDGYAANECVLADGDEVEFFLLTDDEMYGMLNTYLYFDTKSAFVAAGDALTLTLTGFTAYESMFSAPGNPTQPLTSLKPMADVAVGKLDENGAFVDFLYDDNHNVVKTDKDGKLTYTFKEAGTVRLAAVGDPDEEQYFISPYCEVTVYAKNVSADWKNFRNSDTNNGITDAATPFGPEYAQFRWARKLGSGWSAAPSVQIIVDDALIVMSSKTIYKLDLTTGETLATGEMVQAPSYGYTPPAYADGLIYAPLGNGTVQAFTATDLESVWVYSDELKGQALSPITVSDGHVYTGFWYGETRDANFVCLNATTGELEWSYTVTGGFYWAGSVAVGDYVCVGTDDGDSGFTGNSRLLVFKKSYVENEEIRPVCSVELTGCGDQRSALTYVDGSLYFTTKGGYLCRAEIDEKTGMINGLKFSNIHAQSTSTPVVYGDYVYFGTGSGISETGSSGSFVIADRKTLNIVKAVDLKGYPQCSMLLSTAYEQSEGVLCFYSTYNSIPGGVTLVRVNAKDVTDVEVVELYDAKGYEQYCISSMICDKSGNLYYKNDSANVICIGVSETEYPLFDKNLSEDLIKYEPNTKADDLEISLKPLKKGTLSLQWQSSADGETWQNVEGATESRLPVSTEELGTTYFRCVATNTDGDNAVTSVSNTATVTIKVFNRDTRPQYVINKSNAAPSTSGLKPVEYVNYEISTKGVDKPRVWLAAPSEGRILSVEQISGEDKCSIVEQNNAYAYRLYFGSGVTEANRFLVTSVSESGAEQKYILTIVPDDALPFTDIRGQWAQDSIMFVYEKGLVNGMGDGTFAPYMTMSRAMFVQMLYRLDGEPEVAVSEKFKDVNANAWFAEAVSWASENGIVLGMTESTFEPYSAVSRQQAVTMLYRYAQYKGVDVSERADLSSYTDAGSIQPYALEAMRWANAIGLMIGRTETTLVPNEKLIRCEGAVLFQRFWNLINPNE